MRHVFTIGGILLLAYTSNCNLTMGQAFGAFAIWIGGALMQGHYDRKARWEQRG